MNSKRYRGLFYAAVVVTFFGFIRVSPGESLVEATWRILQSSIDFMTLVVVIMAVLLLLPSAWVAREAWRDSVRVSRIAVVIHLLSFISYAIYMTLMFNLREMTPLFLVHIVSVIFYFTLLFRAFQHSPNRIERNQAQVGSLSESVLRNSAGESSYMATKSETSAKTLNVEGSVSGIHSSEKQTSAQPNPKEDKSDLTWKEGLIVLVALIGFFVYGFDDIKKYRVPFMKYSVMRTSAEEPFLSIISCRNTFSNTELLLSLANTGSNPDTLYVARPGAIGAMYLFDRESGVKAPALSIEGVAFFPEFNVIHPGEELNFVVRFTEVSFKNYDLLTCNGQGCFNVVDISTSNW